ncbi:MAG: hypothetical protein AAGD01_03655 [Acidobacteriota bacterium]
MDAYRRFALKVLALAFVFALVVSWPMARWAGTEGIFALIYATAIATLASLLGAVPLVRSAQRPQMATVAALQAMMLRLAVVVTLGALVALAGLAPALPLVVALALAYVVLLALETRFALEITGALEASRRALAAQPGTTEATSGSKGSQPNRDLPQEGD